MTRPATGSGGTATTSRSPGSCTSATPLKTRSEEYAEARPAGLGSPSAGTSRGRRLPGEIEAGAGELLALARGHQLAGARKQLGLAQRGIASAMGVSVARVAQIEHGKVASLEVIARYVEALRGRLDLVADFGDRTVRLPVSDTTPSAAA